MTLEELKERKLKMDLQLEVIIEDFQKETGILVNEINVTKADSITSYPRIIKIETELYL